MDQNTDPIKSGAPSETSGNQSPAPSATSGKALTIDGQSSATYASVAKSGLSSTSRYTTPKGKEPAFPGDTVTPPAAAPTAPAIEIVVDPTVGAVKAEHQPEVEGCPKISTITNVPPEPTPKSGYINYKFAPVPFTRASWYHDDGRLRAKHLRNVVINWLMTCNVSREKAMKLLALPISQIFSPEHQIAALLQFNALVNVHYDDAKLQDMNVSRECPLSRPIDTLATLIARRMDTTANNSDRLEGQVSLWPATNTTGDKLNATHWPCYKRGQCLFEWARLRHDVGLCNLAARISELRRRVIDTGLKRLPSLHIADLVANTTCAQCKGAPIDIPKQTKAAVKASVSNAEAEAAGAADAKLEKLAEDVEEAMERVCPVDATAVADECKPEPADPEDVIVHGVNITKSTPDLIVVTSRWFPANLKEVGPSYYESLHFGNTEVRAYATSPADHDHARANALRFAGYAEAYRGRDSVYALGASARELTIAKVCGVKKVHVCQPAVGKWKRYNELVRRFANANPDMDITVCSHVAANCSCRNDSADPVIAVDTHYHCLGDISDLCNRINTPELVIVGHDHLTLSGAHGPDYWWEPARKTVDGGLQFNVFVKGDQFPLQQPAFCLGDRPRIPGTKSGLAGSLVSSTDGFCLWSLVSTLSEPQPQWWAGYKSYTHDDTAPWVRRAFGCPDDRRVSAAQSIRASPPNLAPIPRDFNYTGTLVRCLLGSTTADIATDHSGNLLFYDENIVNELARRYAAVCPAEWSTGPDVESFIRTAGNLIGGSTANVHVSPRFCAYMAYRLLRCDMHGDDSSTRKQAVWSEDRPVRYRTCCYRTASLGPKYTLKAGVKLTGFDTEYGQSSFGDICKASDGAVPVSFVSRAYPNVIARQCICNQSLAALNRALKESKPVLDKNVMAVATFAIEAIEELIPDMNLANLYAAGGVDGWSAAYHEWISRGVYTPRQINDFNAAYKDILENGIPPLSKIYKFGAFTKMEKSTGKIDYDPRFITNTNPYFCVLFGPAVWLMTKAVRTVFDGTSKFADKFSDLSGWDATGFRAMMSRYLDNVELGALFESINDELPYVEESDGVRWDSQMREDFLVMVRQLYKAYMTDEQAEAWMADWESEVTIDLECDGWRARIKDLLIMFSGVVDTTSTNSIWNIIIQLYMFLKRKRFVPTLQTFAHAAGDDGASQHSHDITTMPEDLHGPALALQCGMEFETVWPSFDDMTFCSGYLVPMTVNFADGTKRDQRVFVNIMGRTLTKVGYAMGIRAEPAVMSAYAVGNVFSERHIWSGMPVLRSLQEALFNRMKKYPTVDVHQPYRCSANAQTRAWFVARYGISWPALVALEAYFHTVKALPAYVDDATYDSIIARDLPAAQSDSAFDCARVDSMGPVPSWTEVTFKASTINRAIMKISKDRNKFPVALKVEPDMPMRSLDATTMSVNAVAATKNTVGTCRAVWNRLMHRYYSLDPRVRRAIGIAALAGFGAVAGLASTALAWYGRSAITAVRAAPMSVSLGWIDAFKAGQWPDSAKLTDEDLMQLAESYDVATSPAGRPTVYNTPPRGLFDAWSKLPKYLWYYGQCVQGTGPMWYFRAAAAAAIAKWGANKATEATTDLQRYLWFLATIVVGASISGMHHWSLIGAPILEERFKRLPWSNNKHYGVLVIIFMESWNDMSLGTASGFPFQWWLSMFAFRTFAHFGFSLLPERLGVLVHALYNWSALVQATALTSAVHDHGFTGDGFKPQTATVGSSLVGMLTSAVVGAVNLVPSAIEKITSYYHAPEQAVESDCHPSPGSQTSAPLETETCSAEEKGHCKTENQNAGWSHALRGGTHDHRGDPPRYVGSHQDADNQSDPDSPSQDQDSVGFETLSGGSRCWTRDYCASVLRSLSWLARQGFAKRYYGRPRSQECSSNGSRPQTNPSQSAVSLQWPSESPSDLRPVVLSVEHTDCGIQRQGPLVLHERSRWDRLRVWRHPTWRNLEQAIERWQPNLFQQLVFSDHRRQPSAGSTEQRVTNLRWWLRQRRELHLHGCDVNCSRDDHNHQWYNGPCEPVTACATLGGGSLGDGCERVRLDPGRDLVQDVEGHGQRDRAQSGDSVPSSVPGPITGQLERDQHHECGPHGGCSRRRRRFHGDTTPGPRPAPAPSPVIPPAFQLPGGEVPGLEPRERWPHCNRRSTPGGCTVDASRCPNWRSDPRMACEQRIEAFEGPRGELRAIWSSTGPAGSVWRLRVGLVRPVSNAGDGAEVRFTTNYLASLDDLGRNLRQQPNDPAHNGERQPRPENG